MRVQLVTAPVLEPITLAELKLHLRLDSGSFADNIDETHSIAPGSHAKTTGTTYNHDGDPVEVLGYTAVVILSAGANGTSGTVDIKIQECDTLGGTYADWSGLFNEVLTLDQAPGGTGWTAGDTLRGVTSAKTCVIVTVLTTKTYIVKDRTGTFTLGEVITNETNTADQGTANPIFNTITEVNDDATYEKAYTGTKRYIKTVARVLVAACEFGTSIIRLTATSIEDDLLTNQITSARKHIENITRRQLLTATWDYFLDEFPKDDFIELPFGNLQTVSSIAYKDTDGDSTTMTITTDYLVETNGEQCGRIVLPYGKSWPSTSLYPSNPIKIEFVCGWTTATLVTYTIKEAVKRIAAKMYENRGEDTVGQMIHEDEFYDRLLSSDRLWGNFK